MYQRFKKWPLIVFFYFLKNALMILSWSFTWHLLYFLSVGNHIDMKQFIALIPMVLILQQILLFLLIQLSNWLNNKYSIIISIAQLHKKYTLQSLFSLCLLLIFNVLKRENRIEYDLETFFYLTLILLAMTVVFSYIVYLISRYYQQQQSIELLTKKTLDESNKVSLANEFQHDYRNILLSLNTYLDQNDIDNARAYLSSITNYSKTLISEDVFSQISIISNLPIQGLLINFFGKAQKNDISIHFSANKQISDLNITIDLIDFIRCMSILLDNAIEASLNEENPTIQISFKVKHQQLTVEVRNAYKGTTPLNKMLKNNFTTKQNHQGKGLHIFSKLLKQYAHANYSFEQDTDSFIATFSLPKSS
ncbi:sensor histidine kinase [Enterococcus sp. DIV0724b]|uniref:sensor histidine kinase n=1 Tax=Enterococcus sp. DIV0724b TaxID=2774694 RepID=UPI003D2FDD6C